MAALVADLDAEQTALRDVLRGVDDHAWLTPTPAEGWDVRDSVSHLADIDEIAADTVLGGPRAFDREVERFATPEELTLSGCLRGRSLSGAEVLAWWEQAAVRQRDAFLAAAPDRHVPWGIGMKAASLVTARIMETWAHGLDVRAALGAPDADTDRLRHVAWIGVRALPYAFRVAEREPPEGSLRVELVLPSGAVWSTGPTDAGNVIRGPAGEFCRVFVQRLPRDAAAHLEHDGPLADAALDVARAYL